MLQCSARYQECFTETGLKSNVSKNLMILRYAGMAFDINQRFENKCGAKFGQIAGFEALHWFQKHPFLGPFNI